MSLSRSAEFMERACRVIPGGINSNVRAKAVPAPLCYERAAGSRLWDADGNEYIDYVLGQGPMLLGHSPRAVIEAIQDQLTRGLILAGQTTHEAEMAELICELVPCAEMVRFGSTGSEAVHAALRLARAATGRRKILRFEGHYHGWLDTIAWNHADPAAEVGPRSQPTMRPSSLGQSPEDAANVFVLPWNDLALVEELFAKHWHEIAAIITEPIMFNWCGIEPATGFHAGLRRICDRYGTLLIFDEVITGFRVALGGAQQLFGIVPDLATFGKALGCGTVISALAGREHYMKLFGQLKTVHAGTYNSNSISMAGALAAIRCLAADGGAELAKAHAAGNALMDGIRKIAQCSSVPLCVRGASPVFHVSILPQDSAPVVDYRSSLQTDFPRTRQFIAALHERSIRVTERGVWFVSSTHTQADVDRTLVAVKDALKGLK